MSTTVAASVARARTAIVATATLAALAATARAQSAPAPRRTWELRIASGAFVPAGAQRSVLANAQVTAAQLAWVVRPSLAVTGTFGWARSRDVATSGTPKLDVFTSDLGIEARRARPATDGALSLGSFVGLGAGVRSYNYRSLAVDATNNLAAYGAAGGEIGLRRVAMRVEVRDYVTGFRPLAGAGRSATRNDVVVMASLRFVRHHAAQQ